MAGDLDLAGRIMLQDAFSAPLKTLEQEAGAAEAALDRMGETADRSLAPIVGEVKAVERSLRELELTTKRVQLGPQDSGSLFDAYPDLADMRARMQTAARTVEGLREQLGDVGNADKGVRRLRGELGGLATTGQVVEGAMDGLGLSISRFAGPVGAGLAVAAVAKLTAELTTLGMESREMEARFVAFSGGSRAAAENFEVMSDAVGAALTRDEKMLAVSRIMSLELTNNAQRAAQMAEAALYLGKAEQSAQQRLESFTQALVTGSNRTLLQYGISATQVAAQVRKLQAANSSLTEEQARQQAIMDLAVQRMEAVKAAGGSAATAVQELANTWSDLKDALGDVVAPALAPVVKGVQLQLRELIDLPKLRADYQDAIDELRQYGSEQLVDTLNKQAAEAVGKLADAQLQAMELGGDEGVRIKQQALAEYGNEMQRITGLAREHAEALLAAQGGDEAFRIGLRQSQEAFKAAFPEGYDPLKSFNEALDETRQKLFGITSTQAKLGTAAGEIEAIGKALLTMPALSKSIGEFDPEPWRQWAEAVALTGPAFAAETQEVMRSVRATEEAQALLLAAAQASGSADSALRLLAIGAGITSGSLAELVQKIDKLPPAWQAAIAEFGGFEAAYDAVIDEAARKTNSLAMAWQKLTDAGQSFRVLAETGSMQMTMPELPRDFTYDTGPMREYLDMLERANPAAATLAQRTREQVATFESSRQAIFAQAAGIQDLSERFEYLATALLGPGAGVEDLVDRFDALPPSVQAGIGPVTLLTAAIEHLQDAAKQPISVGVSIEGLAGGLADIDSMSLRLAGVLSPEKIRQFRDRARAEFTAYWRDMGLIDEFSMGEGKARWLRYLGEMVSGTLDYYDTQESNARTHKANMAKTASEMRSEIEAALTGGTEVTAEDMLNAKLGLYQNKPLEAGRRLQAIMERGFAELTAHPDWAGLLKIPDNILTGSEDALKAWAARTRSEVLDLARPDLIDWDAFGRQWDEQKRRAESKQYTIDAALTFLDKSGRLKGKSKSEARKEIAQMLGLEEPTLDIDTVFGVADPPKAKADLIEKFMAGEDALPIPVKGVVARHLSKEQREALGLEEPTPTVEVNPLVTGTSGGALGSVGELMGSELMAGFTRKIQGMPVTSDIVAYLVTDFSTNKKILQAAGGVAGCEVATGFMTAVKEGVGNVRTEIAGILAPEVAKIIAGKEKGRSSLP